MTHFFLIGKLLTAQQEGHFSLFRHHMALFNPAYIGVPDKSELKMSYRSQWIGVEDAPQTQALSFDIPLSGERAAVGINVINDKTFIESQSLFFISFSYRLSLSDSSDLYLGIQGGGNSFRVNGYSLSALSPQEIQNLDPYLYDHSQLNPNVGVGLYLKTKKVFISLSAPKILNSKRFALEEGFYTTATDRIHAYISMGRHFSISENWTLTPYFLSRFVNAAPIFNSINTSLSKPGLELGLEYNMGSSMGGNLLIDLGGIHFGYAYTRSVHSEINQYSIGSHELLLKIALGSRNRNEPNEEPNEPNKGYAEINDDAGIGTKNKEKNNTRF